MKYDCSKCKKGNDKDEKKALIQIDITSIGCEGQSDVKITGSGKLVQNGLVALFNGLMKSPETHLMLIMALAEAGMND